MSYVLRPYQQVLLDSSIEHLGRCGSTLVVAATGTGKAVLAAFLTEQYLPLGRVMVVADRDFLLEQAAEKIEAVTGVRGDFEQGARHATGGLFKAPVVYATIQSLRSRENGRKRWCRYDPREFSLLIIDEADLAMADSYREFIAAFLAANPNLKIWGCTATPDRRDKKPLSKIFKSVAGVYDMVDAIGHGWLVPVKQRYLDVTVDLAGVEVRLGDFVGSQLQTVLAEGPTIEKIASDTIQNAGGRRTLCFSDSVENAERLAVALNRMGDGLDSARIVTGETPDAERAQVIADYRKGSFQFLANVGVASRGFDVPEIAVVAIARPTGSRTIYAQAVGRGTRPLPGLVDGLETAQERRAAIAKSAKPYLLVLDLIAANARHELVTCADVLGGDYAPEVVALAKRAMLESSVPMDVAEALERAKLQNAEILRLAAEKGKLGLKEKSQAVDHDPFALYGLDRPVPNEWQPDRPMEDRQRAKLKKWNIAGREKLTFLEADAIIGEVTRRKKYGRATPRQEQVLREFGYKFGPEGVTFDLAKRTLDELRANDWKRVRQKAVTV